MKTDLCQSCGHCWVFQICWHIECSTFTASSFRIWNSSTGIPSPPLVLFIVMLPKAHLTSHSRMSGSTWMITPLWLFGSWRSFLYSSVYSCHLFIIISALTLADQKNGGLFICFSFFFILGERKLPRGLIPYKYPLISSLEKKTLTLPWKAC